MVPFRGLMLWFTCTLSALLNISSEINFMYIRHDFANRNYEILKIRVEKKLLLCWHSSQDQYAEVAR